MGEVIARRRETLKLRQKDVAARLGLPPSHLAKIEGGTRRVDVVELIQLARAMSIDPAELVAEIEAALDGAPK